MRLVSLFAVSFLHLFAGGFFALLRSRFIIQLSEHEKCSVVFTVGFSVQIMRVLCNSLSPGFFKTRGNIKMTKEICLCKKKIALIFFRVNNSLLAFCY